jgi:hypothetical protein
VGAEFYVSPVLAWIGAHDLNARDTPFVALASAGVASVLGVDDTIPEVGARR